METITKQQLKIVNVLVGKLGIDRERKQAIISGFSSGRCTSSAELYKIEAIELIGHLKSMDPEEQRSEVMRRKIISMAHELHWHFPGTNKIDMKRVDGWCEKFGYGKKKLNQYDVKELPKLITQFELGPYRSFINSR